MSEPLVDIQQRKRDHIAHSLNPQVIMGVSNGLERFRFVPEALPDCDFAAVSTQCEFLGHRLDAPLLIASMTGGPQEGERINRHLAQAARQLNVAMGVGSQRVMFERVDARQSFLAVREEAPDILLFGNLGAVQLNAGFGERELRQARDWLNADGVFLHLNVLQELIQIEGDTNFQGLLERVSRLTAALDFPILVKEVGCGVSPETALRLAAAGVAAIDVAGAGGTSWAKIEGLRAATPQRKRLAEVFGDWGLPTAVCIPRIRAQLPGLPLIASGGIRTGLDVAKAIALGADLVSLANPLLAPALESADAVVDCLEQIILELRVTLMLLGLRDVAALRNRPDLLMEVGL